MSLWHNDLTFTTSLWVDLFRLSHMAWPETCLMYMLNTVRSEAKLLYLPSAMLYVLHGERSCMSHCLTDHKHHSWVMTVQACKKPFCGCLSHYGWCWLHIQEVGCFFVCTQIFFCFCFLFKCKGVQCNITLSIHSCSLLKFPNHHPLITSPGYSHDFRVFTFYKFTLAPPLKILSRLKLSLLHSLNNKPLSLSNIMNYGTLMLKATGRRLSLAS